MILPHIMAQSSDSIILQGNTAYTKSQWNDALELYHQVIARGEEGAALYYNTGNCYFKMQKLPEAILYFEKALRLAPYDEDIHHNLSIANNLITDKIDPLPVLFYQRWWNTVLNRFTSDQWGITAVILFGIFWIFIAGYKFLHAPAHRKASFIIAIPLLIISLITFRMAYLRFNEAKNMTEAIIFSPALTVKSSPDSESKDLFVIHEGTKIKITDKLGAWRKIKIANGSVGWVNQNTFKTI